MSTETPTLKDRAERAEDTIYTVIGFLLMPIVFLFAPRFVINAFREGNSVDLNAVDQRDILDCAICEDRAAITRRIQARDLTRELVEGDEWEELAELFAEWDRDRAATVMGQRLTEIGLHTVRMALAEAVYPPNLCNFHEYVMLTDSAMDRVTRAYENDPQNHVLAAILAQLHIDRGWFARGGGDAREVSDSGWDGMINAFRKAEALLEPFDAREMGSPLVAQVKYEFVAGLDNEEAEAELKEMYLAWSDLDVTNQTPHRTYTFHILPRWFGSFATVEQEARAAMERTKHISGAAAYTTFYISALKFEDEALDRLDVDLFVQGMADIIAQSDGDQFVVNALAEEIHELYKERFFFIWKKGRAAAVNGKLKDFREKAQKVIFDNLTAINVSAWGGVEKRARTYLSEVFQTELREGASLRLDENGLQVIPASETQQ